METLQDLCAAAFDRDPAAQAIDYNGRWYTWGEMACVASELNAALDASGIDPKGPVCLVSRNHPATIAAMLGLMGKGRNLRMVYPFQSTAGIIRDVERLQPAAFVLTEKDMAPELTEALQREGIATVLLDGMDVAALPGLEKAGPEAAARTYEGEPQIEILTSGTTGAPKQYAIRHEMIRQHHIGGGLTRPRLDAETVAAMPPALLYMPLGNISGIYTTLPVLLNGQRARLLDRFSIPAWVEYVKEYRPQSHGIPPSMMRQLLDMNVPVEDLASLKSMGSGAAPLDPEIQKAFEDRYGIPVLVSYGATEFGGPVVGMTLDLHKQFGRAKLGTVGRPYPGCDVRIVDADDGHVLPAGEEGLLEVLATRVQPDWMRTSDIGMIDEDGFLFLRGRADGAIMRGGFKVLPETIEKALKEHPAVAEAAVVAVPDERVGQVPGAAIRFVAGADAPDRQELETFLRERVLATNIPVHWRFVDDLPRNPSMKIDRPGVKALFAGE